MDATEELAADVQVEHCTNANRAKKADHESLTRFFDLMDLLVHSKDDRKSTKKQNQDAQWYEPIDGDNIVVGKLVPRCDCTEPYEDRDIEQHINGRLQRVIKRLQAEPVAVICKFCAPSTGCKYLLPGKDIPCDKASENVIGADHTDGTNNEELLKSAVSKNVERYILAASVIAKTRKLSLSTYFFSSAQ